MAKNSKKKGESKGKTTEPHTSSWPNLPRQIRNYIAKQPSLLSNNVTSFGCVVKSWRWPSLRCDSSSSRFPKLVEINNEKFPRSHIFDIDLHELWPYPYRKKYSIKSYSIELKPGNTYKGFSHGYVVAMRACEHYNIYLWHPDGSMGGSLPARWDHNVPFKSCTVSFSPNQRLTTMVLTGTSSPAFAFHSRGKDGKSWVLRDCKIKEPYDAKDKNMQFTNCIGLKGKFYALSLQGTLVEIENDDDAISRFEITRVSASRAVPAKASRQFREYLLESDGELLLVFLVSRKSIDVVDDAEVYRLDMEKLLWVEVEGIGERALFLEDECCMSVCACEIGCTKNCIYFTHDRVVDHQWLIYDMKTKEISRADEIREGVMWGEPSEKFKCRCSVYHRSWC